MAANELLSAPAIVVARRADRLVRMLVDDAASPVTAPDGTVLGRVRQEPAPPARAGRALFLAVSVIAGNPHTARDPAFAVQGPDGSPVLRLAFSGVAVHVQDGTGTEIGVLVNEGRAGGPDVVVRVYGPSGPKPRWSLGDPRGEPLAEGCAPFAQAPALTVTDAAGSPVARTARVDENRVSTEILTASSPLRTILAGFACSLVMPEWIERPRMPTGGGG